MERIVAEASMVALTGAVIFEYLPYFWGIPAAIYFCFKIYHDFIKKAI